MIHKFNNRSAALYTLVLCLALNGAVLSKPMSSNRPPAIGNGPQLTPQPSTVDQVIQNIGNIATTIDNWGYIGGYWYYGLPSGEWPRGSGHNYLAEGLYWMGAINSAGDTIIADSYEDLQGLPTDSGAANPYRIFLSTDTSRYPYNSLTGLRYDANDTVGLGLGNPAHGWRIWNPDSNSYIYNQVYNSLSASLVSAGPTSLQGPVGSGPRGPGEPAVRD